MAIIEVKLGGRGRPLKLDTEAAKNMLYKNIEQVKKNLAQIRKTTSGVRDEFILGSNTRLPEFIKVTERMLNQAENNKNLSLDSIKQIKTYIKATKELGSRTEKVRSRALGNILYQDYKADLQEAAAKGSRFVKKITQKMLKKVEKMTAREKQEFFTSERYQDIKTTYRRYKHITAWSKKHSGKKNMTYQEAAFYLIEQRQDAGKDTTGLEQAFI